MSCLSINATIDFHNSVFQKLRYKANCCLAILILLGTLSCKTTKKHNDLFFEKSPYLRQHASNPVNWKAWGKSPDSPKLKIISIGYAACHWCHVMEQESFADSSIAKIMNENFVSIKVDREERPDIDDIYMSACQLSSDASCGWPLNIIALPDGKPIWIGTYMTKTEWKKTLLYFIESKSKQENVLIQYANMLSQNLEKVKEIKTKTPSLATIDNHIANILNDLDSLNGGLKSLPKFPYPGLYENLIQINTLRNNKKLSDNILLTLTKMANGAIYDHLEGGFARYVLDEKWRFPHFEKMLNDNAQLLSLYSLASLDYPQFKPLVVETFGYLEKHLAKKNGGFYASVDADLNGIEGGYYTWTKKEIATILGEKTEDFCREFSINTIGNYKAKDSSNVLYKISDDNNNEYKHELKQLLKARNNRKKPKIDTKIISSWNALMLKAYVDAYKYLKDDSYLKKAQNLAGVLYKNLISKNEIKHLNYDNTQGFLDDYTYTTEALIALYQCDFDIKWLKKAKELNDFALQNFKKNELGLFAYSQTKDLFIASSIPIIDGVMPSANAVFANNLRTLGILFQDQHLRDVSIQIINSALSQAKITSSTYPYYKWIGLMNKSEKPEIELYIIGKNAIKVAKNFNSIEGITVLGSKNKETLELLKNKHVKGKTMLYVCQNKVCQKPIDEPQYVLENLRKMNLIYEGNN